MLSFVVSYGTNLFHFLIFTSLLSQYHNTRGNTVEPPPPPLVSLRFLPIIFLVYRVQHSLTCVDLHIIVRSHAIVGAFREYRQACGNSLSCSAALVLSFFLFSFFFLCVSLVRLPLLTRFSENFAPFYFFCDCFRFFFLAGGGHA